MTKPIEVLLFNLTKMCFKVSILEWSLGTRVMGVAIGGGIGV